MNKRIRRKVHKRYLNDIVCDISLTSPWRKKLFSSDHGTKFLVDMHSMQGQRLEYIRRFICRYRLRYYVSKVPHSETTGWEGREDMVMFKFEAVEFPKIFAFSANNPEVE